MTSYATVIVTRNRPDALALSLPLHLAQTRPPEEIVVIDSSEGEAAERSRAAVEASAQEAPMPVSYHASASGISVQRNLGLTLVRAEVTFMPDDDSLVYPGAMERIMRVYERDAEGRIGGVAGREEGRPPLGALGGGERPAYAKRRSDRLRTRFAYTRKRLEDRFFPDPLLLTAQALQARLPPPEPWLAEEDAVRVEWMTGFRMSFRTEVIRRIGFAESLGRYALYEDIEAGFRIMAGGHALVATHAAPIYHHKAPAKPHGRPADGSDQRAQPRLCGAPQRRRRCANLGRDAAPRALSRRQLSLGRQQPRGARATGGRQGRVPRPARAPRLRCGRS